MENLIKELNDNNIFVYVEARQLKAKSPDGKIPPELLQTIKSNKNELIQFLNDDFSFEKKPEIKIGNYEGAKKVLSFAQQQLWLTHQIEQDDQKDNMPIALQLDGDLNIAALTKAFQTIIERHQVLRTNIQTDDSGEAIQVIRLDYELSIPLIDLSGFTSDAQAQKVRYHMEEEATSPFNLSTDLMLRVQLLKRMEQSYILLITMHHIASDGWSQGILINELSTLYRAFVDGKANPLPPIKVQYSDYAHWQRHWLQGEVLEYHLKFWKKQLQGLPEVHSLPLDHPRPAVQSYEGANHYQVLNREIQQGLNTLARKYDVTLFMVLNAAFAILLSRHSNRGGHSDDIVIGTPVANREQSELAPLVGYFINALVLRTNLSDNPTFDVLLQRCKTHLLQTYEHQQLPFEKLVEELKPDRHLSYSPLFQVLLMLQNNRADRLELPNLTLKEIEQTESSAKYDLSLDVVEGNNGLNLRWEYATALFDASTIERMAIHFEILLKGVLDTPQAKISDLPVLCLEEKEQLLQWSHEVDTRNPDIVALCLHELFELEAERTPSSLAVLFVEANHLAPITYKALNEKANQVAHYLVKQGVKPNTLVGLCTERSLDMVIGLLGILKAGGTYVPIDPHLPEARIKYILQDSGIQILLAHHHLLSLLPLDDQQIVLLDNKKRDTLLADYSTENLSKQKQGITSNHPAYVMYTSGSTGQPKGILTSHQSAANYLNYLGDTYQLNSSDKILQLASFSFDASVRDIFGPLTHGSQIVLPSSQAAKDPAALLSLIREHQITGLLSVVPSLLKELVEMDTDEGGYDSLRLLLVSGEALSLALCEIAQEVFGEQLLIVNQYGPTECTMTTTYYPVTTTTATNTFAPIGRPIPNMQVYILDEHAHQVPIGVPGELHISGIGLAQGYLNRPTLTAQKFIQNPFSNDPQDRLYKTGDLVRWLPETQGQLEFIGRMDHQVKIRGFRVELGEIEARLLQQESIKEVVVVLRDKETNPQLVAYLIPSKQVEKAPLIESLHNALMACLPEYMIPAAFVILEKFPLTPNGKINRQALPAPNYSEISYVPPATETEQKLCEIWQRLLKLERISATASFFKLGGHSLLVIRLLSEIRKHWQVEIPIKTMFEAPTLQSLAEKITQALKSEIPPISAVDRNQDLPLSFAQQRLWFVDQMEGSSVQYNMPESIKLKGTLNQTALQKALDAIIERHEILRTTYMNKDGEACQIIHPPTPLSIEIIDISNQESIDQTKTLLQLVDIEANTPFDLKKDCQLRVKLIALLENEHVVLFTTHHIASDGWSIGVLIQEFVNLYQAFNQNHPSPLPPLSIQYADYAHWQRALLSGKTLEEQLTYWKKRLVGIPLVHNLPLDNPRPKHQDYEGHSFSRYLDKALLDDLNQLAQTHRASLFMILQSAFALLLSRWSHETDIVMGCQVAGRNHKDIEPLIGCFVNTLVFRTDLSGNPSFNELITQSKENTLDAFTYQAIPFEMLVDKLQPERNLSYGPIIQILFSLQNFEQGQLQLPDLTIETIARPETATKFDLDLRITETKERLVCDWYFAESLFGLHSIQRMASSFEVLLQGIIKTPELSIEGLPLLSQQEQQQLDQWYQNQTNDYSEHRSKPITSDLKIFEKNKKLYDQTTYKVEQEW